MFLGIVGHDLRNPLSTILTTSRLLVMREDTPGEIKQRMERVTASGVRMQRMIEQLLDLTRARLTAGIPVTLTPHESELASLVGKIVDEVRTAHPRSRIELRVEGDCRARIDSDRIEQVVSNLLGNAVTHGDATKPIQVVLASEEATVSMTVHNYGAPIDPAFLPLLFNPFARGEQPRGRSAGLGLGLYVSERIIAAHGGTLSVQSSLEAGTRFEAILPHTPR